MRLRKFLQIVSCGITILVCRSSLAYNFLYIHPTSGQAIGWESGTTIQYYVDPGPLGSFTSDQLLTLIQESFRVWENASTDANVPHFEFGGYLSEDVDGTNYEKYVSLSRCYSDDLDSCPSDAQKNLRTVIIFDDDGSVLGGELCRIISCLASAGAGVFSGSSTDPGNIVQGQAVFGAALLDLGSVERIVGVMVHEIGHLLGLAHTYVDQQWEGTPESPTMMTSGYDDRTTLNPDDIAGISVLYPSDTFASETATIKGEILKSDGTPMIHVNVIARNVEDPLCEAYSWLSGRVCEAASTLLCETSIYNDPSYIISGLPPGTYTLEVEEVANNSLAMTLAPGLVDPFIYGDAEFWNEGDAADDPSHLTFSTITLAPGETREDVDIVLNRSEVTDDRIKYIPLDFFTPGPGTRCPEEPPVDYAEMIGIDEGGSGDAGGTTDTGSAGGCSLIRDTR